MYGNSYHLFLHHDVNVQKEKRPLINNQLYQMIVATLFMEIVSDWLHHCDVPCSFSVVKPCSIIDVAVHNKFAQEKSHSPIEILKKEWNTNSHS